MTTLDSLETSRPDATEVARAALAMADFDAKDGDPRAALEWLGVAELHIPLTEEYVQKQEAWRGRTGALYAVRE